MAARIDRPAMTASERLAADWERFDEAAFEAERRIDRALDAWCDGRGAAPAPEQIGAARRLRFIARHRLRWILFQTRTAQLKLGLL